MAKDPMHEQDAQDTPEQTERFGPQTLFVAVTDSDATYAGYDGGPQRGGKGRWKAGEVGQWTADYPPPLAYRDPDDGMIWRGWLEVCTQTTLQDGVVKCLDSQKRFRAAPRKEARSEKHREVAPRGSDTPTPAAEHRARSGGESIKDVMDPYGKKGGRRRPGPAEAIGAGDFTKQ